VSNGSLEDSKKTVFVTLFLIKRVCYLSYCVLLLHDPPST